MERGTVIKRRWMKKLPPGTVVVDRTSRWGNPSDVNGERTLDQALVEYCDHLLGNDALMEQLPGLGGKSLACWDHFWDGLGAPPLLCHADILVVASVSDDPRAAIEEMAATLRGRLR